MRRIYNLLLAFSLLGGVACEEEVRVMEETPLTGSDNHLVSLVLTTAEGENLTAQISETTIRITPQKGIVLEGATAQYELAEMATIQPDPQEVTTWDEEQLFRVTSYSGKERIYKYEVIPQDIIADETIILNTQKDVEEFAQRNVSIIGGNLFLGSSDKTDDPIVDLSPLGLLEVVKNYIYVNPSFAARSLAGMTNLREVGVLVIQNDVTAEELEVELPALTYLSKFISSCPQLSVVSMPVLERIADFKLSKSKLLKRVNLPVLRESDGDLSFVMDALTPITEITLPKFESFQGTASFTLAGALTKIALPALRQSGKELSFKSLPQLENLNIESLQQADGNLLFTGLNLLTKLDFEHLEKVGGQMNIESMPALHDLSLPAMTRAEDLKVRGCPNIEEIAAPKLTWMHSFNFEFANGFNAAQTNLKKLTFPLLEQIEGMLTLKGEFISMPTVGIESLKRLGGFSFTCVTQSENETVISFPRLEECTGNFQLYSARITEVHLPELRRIGGQLFTNWFEMPYTELELPKLEFVNDVSLMSWNIERFSAPQLLEVGKSLAIRNTKNLREVNLPRLERIGMKLWLIGLTDPHFSSLAGLSSLKEVKQVEFNGYPSLEDFSPLQGVDFSQTTSWRVLKCGYNPTLQDVREGNFTEK